MKVICLESLGNYPWDHIGMLLRFRRMPLTAVDRIVLIRVKLERARQHLRDLEAAALDKGEAPVVVSRGSAKSGVAQGDRTQFISLPRLPFNVLAITGDVVHNLRTALDHLAYQLVVVGSGREPSRRVEFPIAKDLATYEATKAGEVEGMRPAAIKAIDSVKPYKGGNDALWKIHELDNIDKHRPLFTISHDYLFFAEWFAGDYWLKADTPYPAGLFDTKVEIGLQLEVDKAFSAPRLAKGNSLLPSLHQLVDVTEELIKLFKPFLE